MKNKLLPLIIFLLIGYNSFATHFAGGNIYYDCIGLNQYRVWVEITTDCFIFSGTPTTSISFTNSCSHPAQNVAAVFEASLAEEVSQICPSQKPFTSCNNGNLPGRFKHVYSAVVTLAPCNIWTVSVSQNARNAAVVNLQNPQGNMYLETTINSQTAPCNNSVRYTGVQNPYVCINSPASYNFGGVDPDGDSLVYVLIDAKSGALANYAYTPPYSAINPISGMALNFSTGTITFTPNTLGSFVVVVQVFEYDSVGNLKGTTLRDIQIVVYNCAANNPPDPTPSFLYNLVGQGTITGSKSMDVCSGDAFCVSFDILDSNAGDTLSLFSTTIASVLPGATLTYSGTNPIVGTLCWTVPPNMPSNNSISLTVDDGFCPVPAQASFSISINVIRRTTVSPDITICLGDSTPLTVRGGNLFTWTTLSGPPISVGNNFDCTTCNPVLAKPSATTTYEVTTDLAGSCINKDTVTVTVASNFIYSLSQTSTQSCRLDPINFAITTITPGVYTYTWTPALMLNSNTIPNPTLTPTQGGVLNYQIVAVNAEGCMKIDTISVFVSNSLIPRSDAFTDRDTVICNQTANLTSWIDTLAAKSDFIDYFDDAFSPYSFLSTVRGGSIGTGCGAFSPPNSLNFNEGGTRVLRTASIEIGNCDTIEYALRLGNRASGFLCDNVENTDPVVFEYSTNGGATWNLIFSHNFLGWLTNTGWQQFKYPVPAGVSNAIFRWTQPNHGGAGQDNWALDNIKIGCSALNNYDFSWSPTPSLTTTNTPTTIAQPTVSTNYRLIVTDTTGGCADTSYVYIESLTDYPDIDISIDENDGCEPVIVTFTNNTDPTRIGTILWDFGDGTTSTALTNPMVHTYANAGTYDVQVTITSPNGCVSDTTYNDLITVYPMPLAFFVMNPQPTNIANPYISFYDQSSNFVTQWLWDFGINEPGFPVNSNDQNPSVKYPDINSGTYPVTLITTTNFGCADTITRNVIIDGLFSVYLPTSFTPNEDGLNDDFGPRGEQIDVEGFNFTIFNRWGEMVFNTTDILDRWNGKLNNNGELVPEGAYVWKITAINANNGQQNEYFGHVMVIKKPIQE